MIKADMKFSFENKKGKMEKASFSNFELLRKEVDYLKELVNAQSEILVANDLQQKIPAPSYNQEIVYAQLLPEEDPEDDSDNDDDSDDDDGGE